MHKKLVKIIDQIGALPGLGKRSARRLLLHLAADENSLAQLLSNLNILADEVKTCRSCGNLDMTAICSICEDPAREQETICVVENVSDLWAIERSGIYKGQYHVLGGVLSAIDGIGPDQLNLIQLQTRLAPRQFKEVIIATNPTIDGRTTAHYLVEFLAEFDVMISRLGYGIPIGGELDYLDDSTLEVALATRKPIEGVK